MKKHWKIILPALLSVLCGAFFAGGCEEETTTMLSGGTYTVTTNTEDGTDDAAIEQDGGTDDTAAEQDDGTDDTAIEQDGGTDDTATEQDDGTGDTDGLEETEQTAAGLAIAKSDFSTTATLYTVKWDDGSSVEVIAVLYGGEYRTAFNTCQVCYSSSRGYFLQSGSYLVCQNCGAKFPLSQVGVASGGCNPYPIYESDRADTENFVVIPDKFLLNFKETKKNWST